MIKEFSEITYHRYSPTAKDLSINLQELKNKCPVLSNHENVDFASISTGMNHNFFVYIDDQIRYQLKILARNSYPAVEKIHKTYELLEKSNVSVNKLVHASKEIFPYGYFLYEYIEGNTIADSKVWIRDFAKILRSVHEIKLPFYGSLSEGYQAKNIFQYYENIDKVIDSSFGHTFIEPFTIYDLVESEIISEEFLTKVLSYIKNQAESLPDLEPHLCHGDMSKNNLLYSKDTIFLIDWDEAKSHTWPSELARLLYYTDDKEKQITFDLFVKHYDSNLSNSEVWKIIMLEHLYQHLRNIIIVSISNTREDAIKSVKPRVRQILKAIEQLNR